MTGGKDLQAEPAPEAGAPAQALQSGDRHLVERLHTPAQVYRGRLLDVRCDTVSLPDGSLATREYIVHPGAVMIVPILDDGRLVLERQYRYPIARTVIEFPAGKLEPGEPALPCARRELAEETGYRARYWALAGRLHNAIAYSSEAIEVWFARGLVAGTARLDEGEFLDVFSATLEELQRWAVSAEITDAKTLVGMLWLQQWRAGVWPLHWQEASPGDQP